MIPSLACPSSPSSQRLALVQTASSTVLVWFTPTAAAAHATPTQSLTRVAFKGLQDATKHNEKLLQPHYPHVSNVSRRSPPGSRRALDHKMKRTGTSDVYGAGTDGG
ncbi:hypothetical protein B0H14DRAFT_2903133 [Mycena olivaceomarginata]|nr:hypothetical protein B0H14DRAFT_2903133 [Mycena olivaceomarginata]